MRKNASKFAIGVTSLATVGGHYAVSQRAADFQQRMSDSIKVIAHEQIEPIKQSISDTQLQREREFVRKQDLDRIVVKVDQQTDQISSLREEMASLEGYLKGRERERNNAFWGRNK